MLNSEPSNRGSLARPRLRGIGIFPGLPWLEAAFLSFVLTLSLIGICLFIHVSRDLKQFRDVRLLQGGVADGPAVILAAPAEIWVGMEATPAGLAARLRNGLYAQGESGSSVGTFKLEPAGLEIHPGPASFFRHAKIREGPAELKFHDGRITSIRSLGDRTALQTYWLEPEVITTLSGFARSEEHLVRYQDVPPVLVNAVIATEDHRFFSHHGVNPVRIVRAAMADLRGSGPLQGGSTLTMQLARNLFLTPRRTIDRKLEEICLAMFLEMRLSKQQIFELYANRVYLGRQGNFSIFGLGDATEAYFHKDVSKLSLPEAALLAGLICGPNRYSPYRDHDRALERRAIVLREMVETGAINPAEAERAIAAPLNLAKPTLLEAKQESYFEDMVTQQLRAAFTERELRFNGLRVHTTLDLDLQRAASEGAQSGSAELDQKLKMPRPSRKGAQVDSTKPQFSLVALDPHTGEVKALVGGRDYGASQLNHALARRQPGSSFKPFVYAAALSSAVDGSTPVITPATLLIDQPTQFKSGNLGDKSYVPRDYGEAYHGMVTVREALMDSLNVPAVSLAQMAGYEKVRNLALAAGFNSQIEATPSIALGAYEATPMEVAGGYTIFANDGQYISPRCIAEVDDASGAGLWRAPFSTHPVIDPRVSYLMVSLMESVINNGTGYGVRSRGFRLPAAGKTGTSHDGWFVGFTSNLLAAVWVGYDDNRELNLNGGDSALPIWTEFMKRATGLPPYRNGQAFAPPPGIVSVPVETSADSADPPDKVRTRYEVFIQGTQPASVAEPTGVILAAEEIPTPNPRPSSPPPRQGLPQEDADPPPNGMNTSQTPTNQPEKGTTTPLPDGSVGLGRLQIQTDPPGLEVFIDGKSTGQSPITLAVPVGEHTYKVAPPPGDAPIERTVQITTTATTRVNIRY